MNNVYLIMRRIENYFGYSRTEVVCASSNWGLCKDIVESLRKKAQKKAEQNNVYSISYYIRTHSIISSEKEFKELYDEDWV